MNKQLLFLGGGNMATAIVEGLLRQGMPPGNIHVLELLEAGQARFRSLGVNTSASLPAGYQPDVAVLAVKPQQMQAALSPLTERLRNSLVISIAAGLPVSLLSQWLDAHPRIVRSMPNTPAMVGMGITGVYASQACTSEDRLSAQTLLQACGEVLWLDSEDMLNPVTAISGSGPGYVFLWMEALQSAAVQMGFDADQARLLVAQTLRGAAELASQSPESFATLRERVTSKGGTTAAGLQVMIDGQVQQHITAGAQAANARAIELGELLRKQT
jgi:pyrroline-5-carboxylate reductase